MAQRVHFYSRYILNILKRTENQNWHRCLYTFSLLPMSPSGRGKSRENLGPHHVGA